jgi:predicted Zn-dependent protease
MLNRRQSFAAIALLCALVVAFSACSRGKKKEKGRRTILMTEFDDARVGRESVESVRAQMGILEDPDLEAYIRGIGKKLLRGIPHRAFDYNFWVVDQVEPNAFALPGGYIFISRGLLALVNNEDELACVIGHEITHAAHRHSSAQQGLQSRGNPLAMPWGRAARMAGYGRDMERDADKGGQILCAAAGYDPMGMSTFLSALGQTERLRLGYSRIPSFFDTHPGSSERASVNAMRASELRWKRDPAIGDPQESLLAHTNGIAIGQRPEAGVFVGDRFLHPDLDFQLRFPSGWYHSNTNQAVGAGSPRGKAAVFMSGDLPSGDPKLVGEGWVEKIKSQQKVKVKSSKPVKIGQIRAWRIELEIKSGSPNLTSFVTFIPFAGGTWRITGTSTSGAIDDFRGRLLNTARSFRPMTDKERSSIMATRMQVVTARGGEDIPGLSKRTRNAWDPTVTAVYNGVLPNHRFERGDLVKIALVTPYTSKPRPVRPQQEPQQDQVQEQPTP